MRLLILTTALLGVNYIVWRWWASINWSAWWIAIPLVLAETYSVIDSLLFGTAMWRMLRRDPPPPPPEGATVDVLITTYDEPTEMVLATARAAQNIRYPHRTWILDDGERPQVSAAAQAHDIGYITRSTSWTDKPRHAKAGNLNNALLETDGEFILVLDADQIPAPEILDHTLGYFRDPYMALVQTPQYFHNVAPGDPLGCQAPLFYGPIQQGKDGWNAAYFCGTNAILRREALMQLGVRGYVDAVEEGVHQTLIAARAMVKRARRQADSGQPEVIEALDAVDAAADEARTMLHDKHQLADITYAFQQRVDAAARRVVDADISLICADLEVISQLADSHLDPSTDATIVDEQALSTLAQRDWSPLRALESIQKLTRALDVGRDDEAEPMLPITTISVTEDMATCMRLHASGWRSAYHHEVLARGLAPEDLRTMLTQRLRWAQGTVQVMLKENPFLQKGLSIGQKLMYWTTMYSYLAGFAALAYFAAPAIYLIFGSMPVQAYSWDFFGRLVPFLILNQLMFFLVSRGTPTWRGQQYSLALFPVWIRACCTAFMNVYFDRPLGFAVTPKTRQQSDKRAWHLVRWQLVTMTVLVVASMIGLVQLYRGATSVLGVGVNVFWVMFNLLILSVVIKAVRFDSHRGEGA